MVYFFCIFTFNINTNKMKTEVVKSSVYEAQKFKDNRERIKDDVIKAYQEHYSFKKVAEIFGVGAKLIARIIKENDIPFKGRGEATQLVKTNPFENTTAQQRSYWLGFIAGDGYVSKDKNTIQITSTDLELIEQFEEFVGDGIGRTHKMLNSGLVYVAKFSNAEAKEYLVKRGVTTNKSKTLKFNVKLNWDIIRGIFDADGSFSQNRLKITTASKAFIEQLTSFYKDNGLEYKVSDKGTGTCWDVYLLGGKETITKVYNHFYRHDPEYYLTRKREQIRRYIE